MNVLVFKFCANKISQNVQVIGGQMQNSDLSETAHQECNFSNTQVFPENPIPNNTSPHLNQKPLNPPQVNHQKRKKIQV